MFIKAAVPAAGATAAKIAVLTASDRAAGGIYEDKSGPAVVEMLKLFSDPWRSVGRRGHR